MGCSDWDRHKMSATTSSRRWGFVAALSLCFFLLTDVVGGPSDDSIWYRQADSGEWQVEFYFFWSRQCPHCLEAHPFVENLPKEFPWLRVHSAEVSASVENARLYMKLAGMLGEDARSVPGFLFCGEMHVGYDSAGTTGAMLRRRLLACRARLESGGAAAAPPVTSVTLPLLGAIDMRAWSLPLATVTLAGLDAFNPCAFFVLLFLLSLMAHAASRRRMALVGGVFVLCSGLVYFIFMAAWLNVFLVAGELRLVTLIAGALAVAMAVINIKDFFWFKRGVTLSIPERAQPGLFARMRGLVGAQNLAVMLVGTVMLALTANAYELLCTAGFPMIFTRLLTLAPLPITTYYLYLALYNLIYVLPLAAVTAVCVFTLGARKLSMREGRALKLLSGLMMLGLGILLLVAPVLLSNGLVAVLLLAAAIMLTALAARLWPDRGAGA